MAAFPFIVASSRGSLENRRETPRPCEDLTALAEELQRQQELIADTAERLDFLERALVQRREEGKRDRPPSPVPT